MGGDVVCKDACLCSSSVRRSCVCSMGLWIYLSIYVVSVCLATSSRTSFSRKEEHHRHRAQLLFKLFVLAGVYLPEVGFEPTRTFVHWNLSPTP